MVQRVRGGRVQVVLQVRWTQLFDRLEERLDNAHRLALEEAKPTAKLVAGHARELGRRNLIMIGLREKLEKQPAASGL